MGSTGPLFDLLITNCQFGNGHGVSIGSGISGITNLTVANCNFTGTGNGLRVKCAEGNSLPIRNLNYFNIAMTNVRLPIVFYTYYNIIGTPDRIPASEVLSSSNSFPVNATTPDWANITISNLTATSTDIGGIIWGPVERPISNVMLSHVTITAPKTFDLYNARDVRVIDSTFNFSDGNTFTLCNAGLMISNSVPGKPAILLGGAGSNNSLALYNVNASMSSADAFACNPIVLSQSTLTNKGTLAFPDNQVTRFTLGTSVPASIVVAGNLDLNGRLDVTNAAGFRATNYVLFNYSGSLSSHAVIGSMPAGYRGLLDTNTPGKVQLLATYIGGS